MFFNISMKNLCQIPHAFGGFLSDDSDIRMSCRRGGVGIDVEDRNAGTCVFNESCRRIYGERCAYHNKYICRHDNLHCFLYIRDGLLKKDYVRSHRVAVASSGRRCGLQMVCVEGLDVIGIADPPELE
mgnify:CR=1 FL=1